MYPTSAIGPPKPDEPSRKKASTPPTPLIALAPDEDRSLVGPADGLSLRLTEAGARGSARDLPRLALRRLRSSASAACCLAADSKQGGAAFWAVALPTRTA